MKILLPGESLKTYIDDTVVTVFDTMLGMELPPSTTGANLAAMETQVIGMVGLAGAVTAVVSLRIPTKFSENVGRAMTGAAPDERLSEADVNDVIGELTNIIAGKLKSCFPTNGEPCNLSLPTIIHGTHLDLESVRNAERHSFTFRYPDGPVVVEFYSVNQKETPQ